MVEHRSVSQLTTYEDCPYSYFLRYIYRDEDGNRAWRRPAAWLVQGLGFHTVAEHVKKSDKSWSIEDATELFTDQFCKETARLTEETPRLDQWFASGPYRGPEDLERRLKLGKEQVEKLLRWIESHPEEQTWNGVVEHEFEVDLDGVVVKGFIDYAYVLPDGRVVARDYKTGNKPGKPIQLKTYKVALEDKFPGEVVTHGDFWMGKTGKPTIMLDLRDTTREEITEIYGTLDENIRAERFDPDPEPSKCRFCSVSAACEYRA